MGLPLLLDAGAADERLTLQLVKQLTVAMFDCWKTEQLRAIGLEIRERFARTEAQRQANAEMLGRLRKAYAACMATLDRR